MRALYCRTFGGPWTLLASGLLALHFLTGALLAQGRGLGTAPTLGALLWVGCLLGGTFLLDAHFSSSGAAPAQYRGLGFALLGTSLLVSSLFLRLRPGGKYFFEIMMTGVLLSVLYTLPPIRLKLRAGWDLLVPSLALGFFTPMAGWCATGRGLERPLLDLCVGFFFLGGATGLLHQFVQTKAGTASQSGLIHHLGAARSLTYALGAILVAHLWFAQALLRSHAPLAPLLLSLGAWLGVTLPCRIRWSVWSEAQARAAWRRGLWAWAITDLSLLILMRSK